MIWTIRVAIYVQYHDSWGQITVYEKKTKANQQYTHNGVMLLWAQGTCSCGEKKNMIPSEHDNR